MHFFHLYERYKHRINQKLFYTLNQLPFQKSSLLKAMKYSVFSGSKRLRSSLIYSTGDVFKVNITTLDVISTAIEFIHSYSLIHDDLPCMDNDNFRRGKISCHVKYGESTSLLAGDALQSLAFNILSNSFMPNVSNLKRIKMISELSYSIGSSGMCMGQNLDLEAEKKDVNLSELEIINLYKTSFLMRSAVRLVYFSSNNFSKSILSILDLFSISIGLAFQIQDDILDFKKDSVKTDNKKIIKKHTYPLIIGLDESRKKIKQLHKKSFLALNSLKKKFQYQHARKINKIYHQMYEINLIMSI
ncbi:polyprenyl synthetase family protein [Buchnera aphidicola]|uniref:polyprenyl synthetase family protein n=1 Tax=Buchnera aphidicola TaxID=9 RepID=UPI0001ECFDE3|nr:polyprenyl synthetase family protein [Buchnera aphidicola]ADP66273.1 geranyltranstransferase [Buchnera aphidicola str. LL01 (Acyrthosiphon pisum)]ADP67933.1 geranyltranstransferase [Buchnera aphidicola str. JF98 (Acyrthosiphon pisum)]